ncbi:hypothetical protein [Streptomyces sioyaensis]|uniref:hypothetical protein n=1 Tax=Streptomyces sioyaensis TaxID=67364 RepID=UPI003791E25E
MSKPDEFLKDYRVRWTAALQADVYHMGADEKPEDEPAGQPVARFKVLTYAGPVQYEVTALVDGNPERTETMLSGEIRTFLDERWWERD